jgi:hypothetical protein
MQVRGDFRAISELYVDHITVPRPALRTDDKHPTERPLEVLQLSTTEVPKKKREPSSLRGQPLRITLQQGLRSAVN